MRELNPHPLEIEKSNKMICYLLEEIGEVAESGCLW